jgi:hypothetical protein
MHTNKRGIDKKVCQKCLWDNHWGGHGYWESYQESKWEKEKLVECPKKLCEGFVDKKCRIPVIRYGIYRSICKAPPKWCPYKLEHALAIGMAELKNA